MSVCWISSNPSGRFGCGESRSDEMAIHCPSGDQAGLK
jgi:hypothetical protein